MSTHAILRGIVSVDTQPSAAHSAIAGGAGGDRLPAKDGLSILLIDCRPMLRDCLAKSLIAIGGSIEVHQTTESEGARRFMGEVSICILASGSRQIDDDWVVRSIEAVKEGLPGVPVVLLADALSLDDIVSALQSGVRGYLTTEMDLGLMIEAVRLVASGGIYVPAEAVLLRQKNAPPCVPAQPRPARPKVRGQAAGTLGDSMEAITPREFEVLMRLRQGKPNKLIAFELDMRESTVKVHVQSIMRKLGVTNRTQVAYLTQSLDLQPRSESC